MPAPRTLLLTRPEEQSRDFAAALEAAVPGRFRPVVSPVLAITPVPGAIDLDGAQGLIFTSANGVARFVERCADRSPPAWCVGAMTAAAASDAGFRARSADGDVAALARLVTAECDPAAGPLVHVRGRHAAGDLAGALAGAGLTLRPAEIYDQEPRAPTPGAAALMAQGGIDVVALFSPRSAAIFAGWARARRWDLSGLTAVSLSAAADAALDSPRPGARRVAFSPDRDGMIGMLAEL